MFWRVVVFPLPKNPARSVIGTFSDVTWSATEENSLLFVVDEALLGFNNPCDEKPHAILMQAHVIRKNTKRMELLFISFREKMQSTNNEMNIYCVGVF